MGSGVQLSPSDVTDRQLGLGQTRSESTDLSDHSSSGAIQRCAEVAGAMRRTEEMQVIFRLPLF